MKRFCSVAMAMAICLLNSPGYAQSLSSAPLIRPSDDSATVTELTPVEVVLPGPAMWSVVKGDSRVIIMGFVTPIPEALDWKPGRIIHALKGAKALLIPPEPKVNFDEILRLALNYHAFLLPPNKTLRDVLSAEDYAGVEEMGSIAGSSPFPVERLKPSAAAAVLLGTQMQTLHLSTGEPVSTVKQLAKRARVPVREMGSLKVKTLVRIGKDMTDAQQVACFRVIMTEARWEAQEGTAAAESWAQGDITGLRKHRFRGTDVNCLSDNVDLAALNEGQISGAERAIWEALATPGKTVALINLELLDARNGLLDRLKAAGAEITVPE